MANERVGLLVVRARWEGGSSTPLRATVRLTSDTTLGFTYDVTLTDVDAVAQVVRQWLQELVEASE